MSINAMLTTGRMLILLAAWLMLPCAIRAQSAEPAAEATPTTATAQVPVAGKIVGGIYVEAVGTAFQDRMTMSPLLGELEVTPFDEVLLRVREDGYAFYNSALAPRPVGVSANFDPLAEAVSALHAAPRAKRVIVWFSPYRMPADGGSGAGLPESHVLNSDLVQGKPAALLTGANGNVYLNPGDPLIQGHLEAVLIDLAGRYDIDGILFDLELPAVVVDPARWPGFDWDAYAASVQGLVQAARQTRQSLIIGVADQGLVAPAGDPMIDFRGRWLNTEGIDRLYNNCFVDEQSGVGRFDVGVAEAVRQARDAGLATFIGIAGERNVAVDALAQSKRAVAMGAEGIALADFNRPVLDAGARTLFFNALKSAVLGDGGLKVATRVDRSQFAEAVAATGAAAAAAGEMPATEEAPLEEPPLEESPLMDDAATTVPTVIDANGEEAETVFEMPPPPSPGGSEPGVAPDLSIPAVQDEQTPPGAGGDEDLDRALDSLTGRVPETQVASQDTMNVQSSRAILGELLRDPQFAQKREWKVLAPEVQAREQLKATFPNIF